MIVLKVLFPVLLLWLLLWWGGMADQMDAGEAASFASAGVLVLAASIAALVGICLLGVWIYE